jgi:nicotinate-nucleotide pyrophosphorylase
MGLYDAILIKENHVAAAGGISDAVARARARHPGLLLEVEVETLEELSQAIGAGADRVLLDDFTPGMLHPGEELGLDTVRFMLLVPGAETLQATPATGDEKRGGGRGALVVLAVLVVLGLAALGTHFAGLW